MLTWVAFIFTPTLHKSLSFSSLPFLFFHPTFCYLSGAGQVPPPPGSLPWFPRTTKTGSGPHPPCHHLREAFLGSPRPPRLDQVLTLRALREFWDTPAVTSARSWCRMLSPNYAMSSLRMGDGVLFNPHNVKHTENLVGTY